MVDAKRSDEELMKAYVGGDHEAFRQLFRRYAPMLTRLTVRHLRSERGPLGHVRGAPVDDPVGADSVPQRRDAHAHLVPRDHDVDASWIDHRGRHLTSSVEAPHLVIEPGSNLGETGDVLVDGELIAEIVDRRL